MACPRAGLGKQKNMAIQAATTAMPRNGRRCCTEPIAGPAMPAFNARPLLLRAARARASLYG
ncbi:hypothetical protein GCM10027066_18210 [Dyella jejuensis]